IYRIADPTHTYHFHSPQEVAQHLASHFEMVKYEVIEHLSEEMQERKKQRDNQARTMRGMVRSSLKFVKNDIILRESLHLFLFKPKQLAS
ncbi:MAG: hypothetical protein KDB23_29565, partial [Planctomycetales bacterium]|nr:hypothetical protein [Planctomycetales bacterium]